METIKNEINEIKKLLSALNLQQKEMLTVEEASAYLQLSKSCLYKMTSNRVIPFYTPGGKKIYFKKSDLDDWVFNDRVAPTIELETEIENYLCRTSKNPSL